MISSKDFEAPGRSDPSPVLGALSAADGRPRSLGEKGRVRRRTGSELWISGVFPVAACAQRDPAIHQSGDKPPLDLG